MAPEWDRPWVAQAWVLRVWVGQGWDRRWVDPEWGLPVWVVAMANPIRMHSARLLREVTRSAAPWRSTCPWAQTTRHPVRHQVPLQGGIWADSAGHLAVATAVLLPDSSAVPHLASTEVRLRAALRVASAGHQHPGVSALQQGAGMIRAAEGADSAASPVDLAGRPRRAPMHSRQLAVLEVVRW